MGSRFSSIFNSFFWNLIYSIINAAYNFVSVPILLIVYGKAEYGLIGLVASINVYLKLMDMGLASGNVKHFADAFARKEIQNGILLFQSSLVLYGCIGIINALIILGVQFNAGYLFHLSQEELVVLQKLLLIVTVSSIFSWISNAFEQFIKSFELVAWHQKILFIPKFIQILLILITIKYQISLILFFAFQTFSNVVTLPIFIVKAKRILPELVIKFKYSHSVFRKVLNYSLSIFSFSIFQFSANYLRPLIVGAKLGVSGVADYRIIEGFANLILFLGSSIVGVLLPSAARIVATKDYESEKRIAKDGTRYITLFLSLIVFGFLTCSHELLNLYVGEKYNYLVPWLNIWILTLLGSHNSAISSFVLSNEKLKSIVYISGVSTLVSLLSSWFLCDLIGFGSVMIGYVLYVIMQITFYYVYYYPKILGYNSKEIFWKSFIKPCFLIAVIYTICYYVTSYSGLIRFNKPIITLIVKGLAFSILAIPAIYYVGLTNSERLFLKHNINRWRR